MLNRTLMSFSAVAMLSGCAHVPELPPESQVSAQDILRALRCEVHEVYKKSGGPKGFFKYHQYTINLQLKVAVEGAASADAAFAIPISVLPPQSVTVTPKIGVTNTNTRDASFKIFDKFNNTVCSRPTTDDHKSWLLGGTTGLEEWLYRIAYTASHDSLKKATFTTISYNLIFVVKPSGSVGVKYTLLPAGLNNLVGNGSLGFDKTKTHSMTITLDKFDPNPKGANVVVASFGKKAEALLKGLYADKIQMELWAEEIRELRKKLAALETARTSLRTKQVNKSKYESFIKATEPQLESFTADKNDPAYLAAKKKLDETARSLAETNQEIGSLESEIEIAAPNQNKWQKEQEDIQRKIEALSRKIRSRAATTTRASRERANIRRSDEINDNAIIRRQLDQLILE